ncbi:MAG: cobalamin biosynthesis protein, partial [Cyanobacteria bacterium SW_9_47_5]
MSEFPTSILVLLLAASLDYLIGDPRGWLHPVQVMGWGISSYNYLVINRWHSHLVRRLAGIGLGVGAILGSGLVGWLILQAASGIHPGFGVGIEAILLASCFAARSLQAAAIDVLQPLSAGDVEEARSRLSQYVGRDTENLSPEDIHRAI